MNEAKAFERYIRTKLEAEVDRIRRALGEGAGLGDLSYHAQLIGQIAGIELAKDVVTSNITTFLQEELD